MLVQHYILTQSRYFAEVCEWLKARSVRVEVHLNRSRFSLDSDSSLYTEFLLRFAQICPLVDPNEDLATGLNMNTYVNQLMEDYAELAAKHLADHIDQEVIKQIMLDHNK